MTRIARWMATKPRDDNRVVGLKNSVCVVFSYSRPAPVNESTVLCLKSYLTANEEQ